MASIDFGSIVPSTRDLFQVLGTRRRNMALVALVTSERPAEDAARLHDLAISALAFVEPGPAMQLGAGATKTVPSLCLTAVTSRDACLAARYHGADGVCIDALTATDEWDRVAKSARTMRMAPFALVESPAGAAGALAAGARAVLVRAATPALVLEAVRSLPRTLIVVGEIPSADADALRALVGEVDAAVVPPAVHGSAGFADFVAEVDP